MKLSRAERAALGVTAAMLAVLVGWFLRGRWTSQGYAVTGAHPASAPPSATARVFVPDAPLDLNAADLDDLTGLPGVGQVRAQAILDYRARHGPFTRAEDLMEVPGIGPATYEGLAAYVTVTLSQGGERPA